MSRPDTAPDTTANGMVPGHLPGQRRTISAARVSDPELTICLSDAAAADDGSPSAKRQRLTGDSPRAAGRGAEPADMATRQRVTGKLAEVRNAASENLEKC